MRNTVWNGRTIELRENGRIVFTIPTPGPEHALSLAVRKGFYEMCRNWVAGAPKDQILEAEAFGRL